ncbi:MAG: SpoIIE family protein phosphatase [Planctomycetes bacterium]|nr:SpoIIE family protein phosphatase [Planctomycetota bacterium]
MRLTIRSKLILYISMPLLLMYAILLAGDYYWARQSVMRQMRSLVGEAATNAATRMNTRLEAVMQLADSTAEFLTARPNIQPVQLHSLLRTHLRQNPLIYASSIAFDPEMVGDQKQLMAPLMIRSPGVLKMVDLGKAFDYTTADYAWYAKVKADQHAMWTEPYVAGFLDNQQVISYSTPFYLGEVFRGVVTVSVRVADLEKMLERVVRQGGAEKPAGSPEAGSDTPVVTPLVAQFSGALNGGASEFEPGNYVVLDHVGHVLSTDEKLAVGGASMMQLAMDKGLGDLVDAGHKALAGGTGVVRTTRLAELFEGYQPGQAQWLGMALIPSTGWVLATSMNESIVMGPIMQRLKGRAMFLLLGLGWLMLLVMVVAIRLSRPIEKLAGAFNQLAAGNLDVQVSGVKRRDEIGQLANGFNLMVRQLHAHVDALTAESAEREKVDSELRIARQIQTDLLPRNMPPFPESREFDLCGANVPARHVAGDFFDYFFAPNNLLNIVIADVSGKGVPAAMLMAVTRTIVRNLAMTGLNPAEIVDAANRMLVEDTGAGMFVTMFLMQYDPETGKFTYCNAGHPKPIYFGTSNGIGELGDITAPILGVAGAEVFGPIIQKSERLEVGESLVLYTDGVTEAVSPSKEMFTETRLHQVIERCGSDSPQDICRDLIDALAKFQGDQVADDITIVALRRNA